MPAKIAAPPPVPVEPESSSRTYPFRAVPLAICTRAGTIPLCGPRIVASMTRFRPVGHDPGHVAQPVSDAVGRMQPDNRRRADDGEHARQEPAALRTRMYSLRGQGGLESPPHGGQPNVLGDSWSRPRRQASNLQHHLYPRRRHRFSRAWRGNSGGEACLLGYRRRLRSPSRSWISWSGLVGWTGGVTGGGITRQPNRVNGLTQMLRCGVYCQVSKLHSWAYPHRRCRARRR